MFKKNNGITDEEIRKFFESTGSVRETIRKFNIGYYRFNRIRNEIKSIENVLVISDLHLPYEHKNYLEHCLETKEKFKCNKIISIGDIVDQSGISFHEKDPNMKSSFDEYKLVMNKLEKWKIAFPEMIICKGNHDELPARKGKAGLIPENFIKSLKEIYEFPEKWELVEKYESNNVLYFHCPLSSGKYPYANIPMIIRKNIVIGHTHTVAGIHFLASEESLIWGMSVGSGIDWNNRAFDYQKNYIRKPIISCCVVLNNGLIPVVVPMKI